MNPAVMLKLMGAKKNFEKSHPKFMAFLHDNLEKGIDEGTVIEITIRRPGENTVMANLKVQPTDLELLEGLKELRENGSF